MTTTELTLIEIMEGHFLKNDLKPNTEAWYRRCVHIFSTWFGSEPKESDLNAETISRFLRDKQMTSLSVHYVRSLRHGIMALTGARVDPRNVRKVKETALDPHSWTPLEIAKMIRKVPVLRSYKWDFYRRIIAVGYHTGLSQSDLHRVARADFLVDGTMIIRRGKTGKLVVGWCPPEILDGLPTEGPLFPRRWSEEQFRRDFRRIVKAAGLVGTFKTLRKSSGTEAEIRTGKGHEHLGNSRTVFEKHYLDHRKSHRKPAVLPKVLLGQG